MKTSGIPSGFSSLTNAPVCGETRNVTMPSGMGRCHCGTPWSA